MPNNPIQGNAELI